MPSDWTTASLSISKGNLTINLKEKSLVLQVSSLICKLNSSNRDKLGETISNSKVELLELELSDLNNEVLLHFNSTKDCFNFLIKLTETSILFSTPLSILKALYCRAESIASSNHNNTTQEDSLIANTKKSSLNQSIRASLKFEPNSSSSSMNYDFNVVSSTRDELNSLLLSLDISAGQFPTVNLLKSLNEELAYLNIENHELLKSLLSISSDMPSPEKSYATIDEREMVIRTENPDLHKEPTEFVQESQNSRKSVTFDKLDLDFLVPKKKNSVVVPSTIKRNMSLRKTIVIFT